MRPHPRIRKTVKWGGAALTVVIVATIAASAWFRVSIWSDDPFTDSSVQQGCFESVRVYWPDYPAAFFDFPDPPKLIERLDPAPRLRWRFVYNKHAANSWHLVIPLWMPTLLILALAVFAWRLDALAERRARSGACSNCGYSLAGLPPGALCPECGKAMAVRLNSPKG